LITDPLRPGHSGDVSTPAARAREPRTSVRPVDGGIPSFDDLYEQHFAFVWRSARRLGIVDSALEDVAQEVFLVVHRRLDSLERGARIRSWLFSIVVRVVSDARRSLRRKPANLGGTARSGLDVDGIGTSAAGPEDSLARVEAQRVMDAVLDGMTDARRQVFILAELEQMSVPDIAAAVGANVNTAYARLRAARADFERGAARARASDAWRAR
jgi:RNA polymerase sigma-70 factor (ECF subfamily)